MKRRPFPFEFKRRGAAWALASVLLPGLPGCAGHFAFQEGKSLLQQSRIEEGLDKLQQAVRANPDSTEYRTTYAVARERAAAELLRMAERQVQARQSAAAQRLYQRVLALDPADARAEDGLRRVVVQKAQAERLAQAQAAREAGDWAGVLALSQALLREEPGHAEAAVLRAEALRRTAPPSSEAMLAEAFRKPVSLEFREVPLRQLFEILSRSAGLSFVLDQEIKPDAKASIFMRNGTIESALAYLLMSSQLEKQVLNASTVFIFPATANKLRDYQELNVRSFQLAWAEAKTVAAALRTLFKGREVVVDDKLNMLVVRDTPEAIRVIDRLVQLYDVPEAEVVLELEILEVSRSRLRDLGVHWPESLTLTPLASDTYGSLTVSDLKQLRSSSIGAQLAGGLSFNLGQTDDSVNTLANPRIRVLNREKARVQVGDRVPVVTVTTSPTGGFAENVTYQDIGLKVDVEPVIYRGNDVVIKVGMEVNNITGQQTSKLGTVAYSFGTRSASTTLRLHDGETQVLAGLINDQDRETARKVPGIGSLPMVGRLFGTSHSDGGKSEVMLSITPRVVRNAQAREPAELEFRSGPESRLREQVGAAALPAPRAAGTGTPLAAPALVPLPAPAPVPAQAPVPSPSPSAAAAPAASAPADGAAGAR